MRRPFCVTILLWLVLSLTAWSGLRLYTAVRWWGTLAEFASPPGPAYIALSGTAWLLAGLLLVWGVWQARAWIRYALLAAGAAFAAWYWIDRLLFQRPSGNWPFALVATVLLLAVLTICIFVPGTRDFLSKERGT